MAVINVVLNDTEHQTLVQQYEAMKATWSEPGHLTPPPTFDAWVALRLSVESADQAQYEELSEIRLFAAIEQLITSLPTHGFHLAHTALPETTTDASALSLATAMAETCTMQPQYVKRLQELFSHYLKSPKEIADAGQVGITNRAYGALTEAQRNLTSSTAASIERIGVDRAIGRIEGATAMLVSLEVMNVSTAKKHTSAFKVQVRAAKKSGWVEKIFGEG